MIEIVTTEQSFSSYNLCICNICLKISLRDTVINPTANADISKKHENRFFLIKLRIFYIRALNFPHVY